MTLQVDSSPKTCPDGPLTTEAKAVRIGGNYSAIINNAAEGVESSDPLHRRDALTALAEIYNIMCTNTEEHDLGPQQFSFYIDDLLPLLLGQMTSTDVEARELIARTILETPGYISVSQVQITSVIIALQSEDPNLNCLGVKELTKLSLSCDLPVIRDYFDDQLEAAIVDSFVRHSQTRDELSKILIGHNTNVPSLDWTRRVLDKLLDLEMPRAVRDQAADILNERNKCVDNRWKQVEFDLKLVDKLADIPRTHALALKALEGRSSTSVISYLGGLAHHRMPHVVMAAAEALSTIDEPDLADTSQWANEIRASLIAAKSDLAAQSVRSGCSNIKRLFIRSAI